MWINWKQKVFGKTHFAAASLVSFNATSNDFLEGGEGGICGWIRNKKHISHYFLLQKTTNVCIGDKWWAWNWAEWKIHRHWFQPARPRQCLLQPGSSLLLYLYLYLYFEYISTSNWTTPGLFMAPIRKTNFPLLCVTIYFILGQGTQFDLAWPS